MTLYYIDVVRWDVVEFDDHVGVEFPSLVHAQADAFAALIDLAKEEASETGQAPSALTMVIRETRGGVPVATVALPSAENDNH